MTTPAPCSEVAIREAIRADLLDIYRIEKRSFPQPWPYTAFERFLDTPGFLVADVDDTVVGYVVADSVATPGASLGHIKDLAVAPEYRERGIASTLLPHALERLAQQGASRVKLEVRRGNEPARELYESFDFEVHTVVPRYYDDGEDALIMMRE